MRFHWRVTVVALAILAGAVSSAAQETTGALEGRVQDADGRPVTLASVSVRETASGTIRDRLVDASGHFRFPSLPPGEYELTVEAEGVLSGQWRGRQPHRGKPWRHQLGGGLRRAAQRRSEP